MIGRMALRYLTAGESHGPGMLAVVEGLPAGLVVDTDFINAELRRRQAGSADSFNDFALFSSS